MWTDRANRIAKIEGFEVECRLPERVGNALRSFEKRQALLLRLTTHGGAVGWGESWAFPASVGAFIRTVLAPSLLGQDATAPRAVQAGLRALSIPDRRGQSYMALGAVDVAMWDCFGKIAAQPISQLLGGALTSRVTAYASGPLLRKSGGAYDGLEQEIESYLNRGFRAFKLRVGIGRRKDVEVIRRVREMIGEDRLLMVDLNEGVTVREAVAIAHDVQDARLSWIEEPIPHDDLPGYKRLSEQLPTAVAGGESFCGVRAFRDYIAAGALDVVQPDLAICGGFSEGMRIAGLAEAFGVPVVPHVWGTGINFLAVLQFSSVLVAEPSELPFPMFEYDTGYNPLRSEIFDVDPDESGCLDVPDGPGLGIDIDVARLSEFVVAHWEIA